MVCKVSWRLVTATNQCFFQAVSNVVVSGKLRLCFCVQLSCIDRVGGWYINPHNAEGEVKGTG